MAGAFARASSEAARTIASGAGTGRVAMSPATVALSSHGSVMRSIGSERNTGPVGGVSARWMARRKALGASLA